MKRSFSYPADVDRECVPLCDALNSLPGIATFESCCGHGRGYFRVFFSVATLDSLRPVLEPLSTGTPWVVEIGWANGSGNVYGMLSAYQPAQDAIDWLIVQLRGGQTAVDQPLPDAALDRGRSGP